MSFKETLIYEGRGIHVLASPETAKVVGSSIEPGCSTIQNVLDKELVRCQWFGQASFSPDDGNQLVRELDVQITSITDPDNYGKFELLEVRGGFS